MTLNKIIFGLLITCGLIIAAYFIANSIEVIPRQLCDYSESCDPVLRGEYGPPCCNEVGLMQRTDVFKYYYNINESSKWNLTISINRTGHKNDGSIFYDTCCFPINCYENKSDIPKDCDCYYPIACNTYIKY